jgi:hypothetical protein
VNISENANIDWMSERLLFSAKSAIFQLYHGKNKLIFNEMMMRCEFKTRSWQGVLNTTLCDKVCQ